jgi:hypothetical protein
MVRLALLMVLFWSLTGTASGAGYITVPLVRLASVPEQYVGRRILTTGTYRARAHFTYAADGWLEDGNARLRILGSIFDWQPLDGGRMDTWGMFRRDVTSGEFLFDFFNGRPAGNHRRSPRLTPSLSPGRTVWLVGRLRQTGSEPFVRWTFLLEDRTEVDLKEFPPPGQVPMSGLLVEMYCRVETDAFPPSQAAVRVLHLEPLPGLPPPPFGG